MKANHEYFKDYSSREVHFQKPSGLFFFNGSPIGRDDLEKCKIGVENNTNINYNLTSPKRLNTGGSVSSPKRSQSPLKSPSKIPEVLKHDVLSQNFQTVIQSPKVPQYYSRLETPAYETVTKKKNDIRKLQVDVYKKVYHDDKFTEINNEDNTANLFRRLWVPSTNKLQAFEQSLKFKMPTEKPKNTGLKLSPLRTFGGQDKPHHMPPSKNRERLKFRTKSSS